MINTLEGKEDDCIGIQAEVSLYYTLSDAHDLIKTDRTQAVSRIPLSRETGETTNHRGVRSDAGVT
jgi:hypothetical protein